MTFLSITSIFCCVAASYFTAVLLYFLFVWLSCWIDRRSLPPIMEDPYAKFLAYKIWREHVREPFSSYGKCIQCSLATAIALLLFGVIISWIIVMPIVLVILILLCVPVAVAFLLRWRADIRKKLAELKEEE